MSALKKTAMVIVGIVALAAYLIVGLILFIPVCGAMVAEGIFAIRILPDWLNEFIA